MQQQTAATADAAGEQELLADFERRIADGETIERQLPELIAKAKVKSPKSVIYIFLSGGLAQHESFDMKPDAASSML